jgi:hypothetical protein
MDGFYYDYGFVAGGAGDDGEGRSYDGDAARRAAVGHAP